MFFQEKKPQQGAFNPDWGSCMDLNLPLDKLLYEIEALAFLYAMFQRI
jgi:hypothetical protein